MDQGCGHPARPARASAAPASGPAQTDLDDDAGTRSLIADCLRNADCRVRRAGNGLEALIAVRQQRLDVIVLDLAMPIMDGRAFVEACYHCAGPSVIPVILVSADSRLRHVAPSSADWAFGRISETFRRRRAHAARGRSGASSRNGCSLSLPNQLPFDPRSGRTARDSPRAVRRTASGWRQHTARARDPLLASRAYDLNN
jgi:CheY-like chemotaxis protein